MAIGFDKMVTGKISAPKIIMLYGVAGIGKTTVASGLENPFFVFAEDGGQDVAGAAKMNYAEEGEVPRYKATSYAEVESMLSLLATNPDHGYKSVVIDSLSSLEGLIWKKVCADANKNSMADFSYGKGYEGAFKIWTDFFGMVSWLRDTQGLDIVMIAHSTVAAFSNPDGDNYDRFAPALHKGALGMLVKECDGLLFCNYQTFVKKVETGMNKTENKGIGQGVRKIFTSERPSMLAKNRCSPALPHEMEFDLKALLDTWKSS